MLRCLSSATTGQEFLQFHADKGSANIGPDHFFEALKSPRRLANITSLNELLAGSMKQRIPDPYAQCEQLHDWDLYALDGHYHHAACFDKKRENSIGKLRAIATGHFFRMNMRNHHLSCLGMANPEDGKKKARGHRWLTGVGMLCNQIGAREESLEVRKAADYIYLNSKFDYNGPEPNLDGHCYESQAMIQMGGRYWNKYNQMLRDRLLSNQNSNGSWNTPLSQRESAAINHCNSAERMGAKVYRTTLCILMLEVYYRDLTTSDAPQIHKKPEI